MRDTCEHIKADFEHAFTDLPNSVLHDQSLFEEFTANKLQKSYVIWINRRWFLERGINVLNEHQNASVRQWLLEEFGYGIPQPQDASDAYSPVKRKFYADRYGGYGIGFHGGSGRCGIAGQFQIKGIGVTPLVSAHSDELHSHGAVTLEESIREAVFAEVASQELPYGAVPVIAIIGTGTRTRWNERRAIIVRPNFFRASYIERAHMYRPRLDSTLEHMKDVIRVREIVNILTTSTGDHKAVGVRIESILQFIRRSAEQLAFVHVARLYYGPFASSNLTINGEILDYGSARSICSWVKVEAVEGAPSFGVDDLIVLEESCEAILFYLEKYNPGSTFAKIDGSPVLLLKESYESQFDIELLSLFGLNIPECSVATSVSICRVLRSYY
jgi:uncharacterized protein YdiU (UPF0061 family)